MKWIVYYYSINEKQIKTFNIFNHDSFNKEVKEHLRKSKTKKEFEKKLNSTLLYYYWSKCEWEVLIVPWVGEKDVSIKIDIYSQVKNNWEIFVDYVWGCKSSIPK